MTAPLDAVPPVDVKRSAVLILSSDPMAAALVGAAIEAVGVATAFARQGESPRDALLRTRPAVVAIDCEHDEACSEAFLGPVVMTGAAVAVFGPPRLSRDLLVAARRFSVSAFCLPDDQEQFLELVRRAARGDGKP